MMPTLATSFTVGQAGVMRLLKRLIDGDMVAIAVVGGIVTVIVISFIVWKLMNPKKPVDKSDDSPNLKL